MEKKIVDDANAQKAAETEKEHPPVPLKEKLTLEETTQEAKPDVSQPAPKLTTTSDKKLVAADNLGVPEAVDGSAQEPQPSPRRIPFSKPGGKSIVSGEVVTGWL